MNVLSLFDGISCARIALERAEIPVLNYLAYEVDKFAIKCSQDNWEGITRLGDIKNAEIDVFTYPKIDLLIAGFPCQSFSFAGKQLNFEDERGKLFFDALRIKNEVKPKYFIFENVRMKKEIQDEISRLLGVEPILINSSLVSAQNRKRLYWTNIPGVEQPKNEFILLKDILENGQSLTDKSQTILSTIYKENVKSMLKRKKVGLLVQNGKSYWKTFRKLTPLECERLQTVPIGYTSCLSNTQRYKTLGNGFTVSVISHILKQIKGENKK